MKNYKGSITLRFERDAWLALSPAQIVKRQEMVAELFDWEHPGELAAYPKDLPKPTKQEFGAVMDSAISSLLTGDTTLDDFAATVCDEANKAFDQ